jgi:hypothetical protein
VKIATWNINGVKARIDNLLHWLRESDPDIVCLQEIKSVDEGFPRLEIEALGYHVETHGQKGFNGVAILSKLRFDEVNRRLPGDDGDEQARFIEGVFSTSRGALRVVSLYLPNGNPVETEKFPYKLGWMKRLEQWAEERLALEEPLIWVATTTSFPCRSMPAIPITGSATRCFSRKAALPSDASPTWALWMPIAKWMIRVALIPSGITRPALGRRTTAYASIS